MSSTKLGLAFFLGILTMSSLPLASWAQTDDEADSAPESPVVTVTCEAISLGEPLYFDSADVALLPQSEALLVEVARIINESPWIGQVLIESHTDSTGTSAYNMMRSTKRANIVRDFLISQGVATERLEAQGFGETRPIVPNDTPAGREQNRRIELYVVTDETCPL